MGQSTAYCQVAAARDEKRRVAKPMRGGPTPRIQGAAETAMLDSAGKPHHLSLADVAARLAERHGVRVYLTTVNRTVRHAGWT